VRSSKRSIFQDPVAAPFSVLPLRGDSFNETSESTAVSPKITFRSLALSGDFFPGTYFHLLTS
jgi:hypothetical protein